MVRGRARSSIVVGRSVAAAAAAGCAAALLASGPSFAPPAPVLVARAAPAPSPATSPSHSKLEVVRIDPDPAPPGGTTTVHAFVANRGPEATASPFTVLVALPQGVSPQGPYFPADCEVLRHGRLVRCVFGPGLPPLRTATALVPVRLDPELRPGRLTGGWVAVRSADDPEGAGARQPYDLTVAEPTAG
ncbi:hypothetical protein [Streptomyces sp. NRRL WC-3742]|uniref:hypothetical protein n=1 Tax=Streptomyces sp. NRRL WC-3742 TaxID=1463934 RepID=UPI0004CC71FE|nr:hypothetical protein [Streptomyces sp. NRRL WC-3742]